jgi:hypothetical protein
MAKPLYGVYGPSTRSPSYGSPDDMNVIATDVARRWGVSRPKTRMRARFTVTSYWVGRS